MGYLDRSQSAAAASSGTGPKTRIKSFTRLSTLSTARSTGVDGFTFPLQTADQIERLEAAVREDRMIWNQYVEFLRDKKTEIMDIPSVMKLLFLDEALDGYNFNGIQGRKMQKRPLKMYAIFIDCMLVLKRIELFKQSAKQGVDNFTFPIPDSDTIERLEAAVRMYPNIRKQYVEHLRRVKEQTKMVTKAFPVLFSDAALEMYNYNGTGRKERRPMKDYHVFHNCMLEAWRPEGVNEEHLQDSINIVIKRADGRKRAKLFNFRRRIFQNVGTIFSGYPEGFPDNFPDIQS